MTSADKLGKQIDDLWQKHLPLMRSRIETIQRAVDAIRNNRLTQDGRTDAARDAHKLAGSLGTFGLRSGSDAATELERLLLAENSVDSVLIDKILPLFAELRNQVESK